MILIDWALIVNTWNLIILIKLWFLFMLIVRFFLESSGVAVDHCLNFLWGTLSCMLIWWKATWKAWLLVRYKWATIIFTRYTTLDHYLPSLFSYMNDVPFLSASNCWRSSGSLLSSLGNSKLMWQGNKKWVWTAP